MSGLVDERIAYYRDVADRIEALVAAGQIDQAAMAAVMAGAIDQPVIHVEWETHAVYRIMTVGLAPDPRIRSGDPREALAGYLAMWRGAKPQTLTLRYHKAAAVGPFGITHLFEAVDTPIGLPRGVVLTDSDVLACEKLPEET